MFGIYVRSRSSISIIGKGLELSIRATLRYVSATCDEIPCAILVHKFQDEISHRSKTDFIQGNVI